MPWNGFRLWPYETFLATEADDPQPAVDAIDVVVDQLGKRMVPAPKREQLGRALDAANTPAPADDRAAQDQALGRAIGGRHWPP